MSGRSPRRKASISARKSIRKVYERKSARKEIVKYVPRNFPLEQASLHESNLFQQFGHGSDICDTVTKTLKQATIPSGSAQITAAKCGLTGWWESEYVPEQEVKETDVVKIQHLLRRPRILPSEYFFRREFWNAPEEIRQRDLSVHRSGDLYVDNMYYPAPSVFGRFDDLAISSIHRNGMHSFAKLKKIHFSKVVYEDESVQDALMWSFEHSLYPTADQVKNWIVEQGFLYTVKTVKPKFIRFNQDLQDFQVRIAYAFRLPISILINRFPGVHLYSLCRVVDPECSNEAMERRKISPLT